jgi:hypothetical protein
MNISIVGGIYHERCLWPDWDQIYGSGGRAAATLSGHIGSVMLHGYISGETATAFEPCRAMYGFNLERTAASQTVSFEYVHSMSVPQIRPGLSQIKKNAPIQISGEVVLRFGMMEGSAVVHANRCVYDPQSAFAPEPFSANGSSAEQLAIVGNRGEIVALGGDADPIKAAKGLLNNGAHVVVIKRGAVGADVVDPTAVTHVPAYRSDRVWTVGSGDVFASVFALAWGVEGFEPKEAARVASLAVAAYAESMALPVPSIDDLRKLTRPEAALLGGRAYLASPFFTLGERWVVDEARRCLEEIGMSVFSPVHDIGSGPAELVAPADLAAIDECDVVFAVIDGLDSGTLFEIGYARALKKPVYALAQSASDADLKMIVGSGCTVFDDFVTAVHHLAWRT